MKKNILLLVIKKMTEPEINKKIKDLTPEEMKLKRAEYNKKYKKLDPVKYLENLRENSKIWRSKPENRERVNANRRKAKPSDEEINILRLENQRLNFLIEEIKVLLLSKNE